MVSVSLPEGPLGLYQLEAALILRRLTVVSFSVLGLHGFSDGLCELLPL